jgi:hypothetical protein
MIGTIEILLILLIFGIIYGRDAIDRTFRKHPDESVVESLQEDLKDYYRSNPKRLITIAVCWGVGIVVFIGMGYYAFTNTPFLHFIGLR